MSITLRATTKIRNDHLISFRKKHNLSQKKLGKLCGMGVLNVLDFEKLNFKDIPFAEEKALRLSVYTKIPVEKILPMELIDKSIISTIEQKSDVEPMALLSMNSEHQKRMLLESPEDIAERNELKEAFLKILETLKPGEQEVTKLRYGLYGKEYTLDECAKILKLSRERVRQIECKAIAKLRQPIRATRLYDYSDHRLSKELE